MSYVDNHHVLWYIDLAEKKPVRVDKDYLWTNFAIQGVWSPDSKWLAYSKRQKNYMSAVYLYSLETKKSSQLTDGMSDAQSPVFDKSGKYLFFMASTDSGPALQPDIQSGARPVTSSIYLAVLSKKEPSPFVPESDDEPLPGAGAKSDAASGGAEPSKTQNPPAAAANGSSTPASAASDKKATVEVKIDFDNISQRILAVDLPPLTYVDLQIGKGGILYASEIPISVGLRRGPAAIIVHRFDLAKRKSDVVVSGVNTFEISENGEKMLTQSGDKWMITAPSPITRAL
jgi:tricorn protease